MDQSYWQGTEPKSSEELRKQIQDAITATYQWLDAADIKDDDDRMLVYAQIYWLQELLKLAEVKLKD